MTLAISGLWFALTCRPVHADDLPGPVTAETFENTPNEYRIIQYHLPSFFDPFFFACSYLPWICSFGVSME